MKMIEIQPIHNNDHVENGIRIKGNALFIIPNNHQRDNVFPLGPAYIAAVLRDAGMKCEVYCMDAYDYNDEDLRRFMSCRNDDIICFGFMGPRFKRGIQATCRVINSNRSKDSKFIIGGYGPSSCPEFMLRETGADFAVIGEGEETLLDLVNVIQNGNKPLGEVESIAFFSNGKYFEASRRKTIRYISDIPYPAWDLFPMDIYTSCLKFALMSPSDKAFPVISTRGCTDKCSFCFRLDAGIRVRKPETVVQEMKILNAKYGVNYFYFVDELAIVSKNQITKLLNLIISELPPIKFRIDCRVTNFDEDIALLLKKAGCVFLNIGFETSSQIVLDQMNKRATVEQNIAAAELAIRVGLGMGINMIWGMPGDTVSSMWENAEFIKRFNQYDQIRTIRPVTPYPGSPLYQLAVDRGLLKGPGDFYDQFKNSDLYMINYTAESISDIYKNLFAVNEMLINDHFEHTSKDHTEAAVIIDQFRKLYFQNDFSFRGPRTALSTKHVRQKSSVLDSSITMGVWQDSGEGIPLNNFSGM
jgi:anaerobic magnesium-protoporphyrin IX monomethyl ester cyclase